MDFTRKTYPRFHQVAVASAFTLAIVSPRDSSAADCHTLVTNPFIVNIATEDSQCDDFVSLREAIRYANEISGKDTITFSDSLKGKTVEAVNGKIVINESINISGIDDVELITLKANNEAPLFSIESSADRIDFDLSHVILEKQAGSNHIIEMDGYGGDIVLDDIQTNEVTRAGGIFDGHAGNYSGKNDLNLTLKNSSLSGSIFEDTVLTTRSWENRSNLISIENTTIYSVHSRALASTRVWSNENAEVRLINSTISGGSVVGALLNSSSVEKSLVSIIDSKIHNIESYLIAFADSYSEDSMVEFQRAIITGNTVEGIAGYYDEGVASIEVSESTISSNTVTYSGLYATGTDGTVNIQNSVLCNNVSPYGEDIAGQYPLIQARYGTNLEVSNTEICNNQIPAIKIYNAINTTATIENSLIINNHSSGPGAGIYAGNGGKGSMTGSKLNLNIINSAITGNKSETSGGGIAVNSGSGVTTLNIENSTISNNHAGYGLDTSIANDIYGGGIKLSRNNDTISTSISNSTISHNTSAGFGGGIGDEDNSDINIQNSIVANNTANNGTDHDLFGNFTINNSLIGDLTTNDLATTINDVAINLIVSEEGQSTDAGNNILGQDPLLQDLSLSGGTWVHQLNADSPAIAAGNTNAENLPEFDQRGEGFARIRTVDGVSELDLGAVQYFASPVAINDEVSVTPGSENNLINVLNNDEQNSDGFALDLGSVTIISYPENGDAEVQEDGTISYTPTADFAGTDSLTYVMQDIAGGTSTEATVTITVSENSGDSGGTLHLWFISLLALFGLRRNKHLKKSSK